MPEQNVTTKFKVDISDLKKGIADANKNIKLANAEFKNATAGLDDWSKSADGLTAKIKQQNTVVEQEKKKLDLLKEQLDRLTKSQKDGEKVIADLTDKYNEAVKQYGAASDEAKKYAKELDAAQAAQERNAKAVDDLNLKILNQDTAVKIATAEVNKYENALENLDKENKDAADGFDKTGKSAKEATEGGLNAFGVAVGNLAADVIGKLINKLADLAGAVKDAFLEFDEGADNIIRSTGATGEAAAELTKSYGNVAKTINGDFGEIGDTLGELNTRFDFTGETLEDALVRECREELAVTVVPRDIFMEVTHVYPDLTVHLTLFNADLPEGEPQALEHNDVRWITVDEIDRLQFCPADEEILERLKRQ